MQKPVYVLPHATLTLSVPLINIAQAQPKADGGGSSVTWFPFFILQRNATLVLVDTVRFLLAAVHLLRAQIEQLCCGAGGVLKPG